MADNKNETYELDVRPIQQLDDKKALLRAKNDFSQAQAEKQDSLNRAKRYSAIYEAMDSPEDRIDETTGLIEDDESRYSNTYMPIGAAITDSAVAQMFNLIFSTEDYFKIESDDIEDMLFETEVTAFLKKRHVEMGFKHKIYDALLQCSCFDYCVTGTRWLMEGGYVTRPIKRVESVELAGYKLRKQTVKAEPVWIPNKIDRSDMFVLDYSKCYHDPTSVDGFNDSRFFIDQREESLEWLMDQAKTMNKPWGKYVNIDKVVKLAHADFDKEIETGQLTDMDVHKTVFGSRRVTVKRYWTKHHILEYAYDEVIRRINIYGWPLQLWKVFPRPVPTFEGMGFLQRLERNQLDINASLNARRNFQNLISNPFAVVDEELLGDDDGEPSLYAGRVLPMRSGGKASDKIYIYQPGVHASQTELTDIQMQIEMTQRLSSVDENALGTVQGDRTTATEVRQAAAGRMTRIGVTTQRFEENCLTHIYLQQFFLEMTFLSRTEFVRYQGEQGESIMAIEPSSLMWNSVPRFQAMGTFSVLEDAVKMQQFFTAVQLAAGMPQVQHNWQNIALQMWRYLHPKEYYKFVEDPNMPKENIPPDIENQLMAQGRKVRISPANDHQQHKAAHEGLRRTPDYQVWPESRKMILEQHISEHDAAVGQAAGAPSLQKLLGPSQDSSDASRGVRGPVLQGAA